MKVQDNVKLGNKVLSQQSLQKTKLPHSIQEVRRLVKFFEVIAQNQYMKMLFEINIKSKNTCEDYVDVFSSLILKFLGVHKLSFIREEKDKMFAITIDFESKNTKKVEVANDKKRVLNQFLQKQTFLNQFKIIEEKEKLLNWINGYTTSQQSVLLGFRKQEQFQEEEQYFTCLIHQEERLYTQIPDQKIDFQNKQKLLEIFIDIIYLDQFYNLFLFKNLDNFTYDFFQSLFQNIDIIILIKIFNFLENEEKLKFSPEKNLQKENPEIIIYKYSKQMGVKFHQQSQYAYPQLKQLFKELKKISIELIHMKQYLLQELDRLQIYTEDNYQYVFQFNTNFNIVFTNKVHSSVSKKIISMKKLEIKNIGIQKIFKSKDLISHSYQIVDKLLKTKRVNAKVDSLQTQYKLIFNKFNNEFQGFVLMIEKNSFNTVEIQKEDIFDKIHQQISLGNNLIEVKQLRKKKKKPLQKNFSNNLKEHEELQNLALNIIVEKHQQLESVNDENSILNSISDQKKNISQEEKQKTPPQIKNAQKLLFSPLLERSPSYFAPQSRPSQYVKRSSHQKGANEKSFGFDSIDDDSRVASKNHKRLFSDYIQLEEIKQLFQCHVTYQDAIDQKKILLQKQNFLNNWNFNILNDEENFIQGTILTIFDCQIDNMNIQEAQFYKFTQEVYYYYQRNQNPFHNYRHGVMVCYSTNFFINNLSVLKSSLDKNFQFAFLLAAYCHDLDHPGTNNNFEINSHSQLAIRYSDQSPLEYHHLYQLFTLLSKPEFQFFKKFPLEMFKQIREFMIEIVVATDMKFHFHHLENSKKLEDGLELSDFEILKSVCGLLLHTTDLSHTSKESKIAEDWARRVSIEFSEVYEREQELNIPLTPFYKDLEIDNIFYKSEMNFMNFIILPLFQSIQKIFKKKNQPEENNTLESITGQVTNNIAYYTLKFEQTKEENK